MFGGMTPFGPTVTVPDEIVEAGREAEMDDWDIKEVFGAGFDDGRRGLEIHQFDMPSIQHVYNAGHQKGGYSRYVHESVESRPGARSNPNAVPLESAEGAVEESESLAERVHRHFDGYCAFVAHHEVGLDFLVGITKAAALTGIAVALLGRRK